MSSKISDKINHILLYGLEEHEYSTCIKTAFSRNLNNLRQTSTIVIFSSLIFAVYPIFVDGDFVKAAFYFVTAGVAALQKIILGIKQGQYNHGKKISTAFTYTMIILYYANIIFFGIYLGVISNPERQAVSFMIILMCALLLLNIPFLFYFSLTMSALALFTVADIWIKSPAAWIFDVTNALFAVCLSLFIGWHIIMYRMKMISTSIKLEDESTTDPLTGLKNRRDFMTNFQRFLTNYRQSDTYLCIALADIDFFKNYNDHYGHSQGDECLRILGSFFNSLDKIYTARVGGEEFALLWFERDIENARDVASMINQRVYDLKIPHEKSDIAPYVTVSIGVYVAECSADNDMQTLYDLADRALYAAKHSGRNQAVINHAASSQNQRRHLKTNA